MIRLNGQQVLVVAKESVKYSLINPHLLYDSIPSSQAEIPVFPAVRENRAVFDYYDEPQAGNYLPELLYQHFHNGDLIREGYFLLTEASLENGYKGAYSDKLGLFFGQYQNTNIREMDFGSVPKTLPLSPLNQLEGKDAYCYPTILNDFFYGPNGAGIGYSGRINDYAGSYTAGPKVPMFFAGWVLQKLAAITGIRVSGSFFTHPVWSKLILFNLKEAESESITIAHHLPPLTVTEFILELRKIANLKFEFNSVELSLKIDFWQDALLQPTQRNWTTKAVKGEIKTPETNTRMQLAMQMDSNDGMTKDKPAFFADYVSAETAGNRNGIAQVNMKFSSLAMDPLTGLPICKQEGQSSQFGQQAKPFSPRLLFWHGITGGLPVALPQLSDITLSPAGLAETCWKESIALRKRMFYLQKQFILNEADLAKMDFSQKYHCEGVDYLLAQVNVVCAG